MFPKDNLVAETMDIAGTPFPSGSTPVHIAFAADQKYVRHTGTAAYSVLAHNADMPIHFHLMVDSIGQDDIARFQKLQNCAGVGTPFRITLHFLNKSLFDGLPTYKWFSPATYYRLAIPTVLEGIADRVLYLDADVLCTGSLKELFGMDMEGKTAACAADKILFADYIPTLYRFGFSPLSVYFNAGVMLIDIGMWHAARTNEKMKAVQEKVGTEKLWLLDQDMLNLALDGSIRYLPEQYNWLRWQQKYTDFAENHAQIRLVHFVGGIKPWHWLGFNPIYDACRRASPWADIPYEVQQNPPRNPFVYKQYPKMFRIAARQSWVRGEKRRAAAYFAEFLRQKILTPIRK